MTAAPSYWQRVVESWSLLIKWCLPIAAVYMAYRIVRTGFTFSNAAVAVALFAFLIALAMAGLVGLDARRLQNWETSGDVRSLLGFMHSAGVPSSWKRGCEALVRVGPPAVPMLIQSLDRKTCPLVNVAGRPVPSNGDLRAGAAWCLGQMKEASAIEALRAALKDEDEVVRQYAATALRVIDPNLA
jgi:HEAT repeat protein